MARPTVRVADRFVARPGFVPIGRLIVYLVIIAALIGGYLVFQNYLKKQEEGDFVPEATQAGPIARALAEQHRSAATNPASLPLTDASKMSDQLASWLGTRKTLEELFEDRKGPVFVGARKVEIPPADIPASQLVFKTSDAGGADATASLVLKKYMMNPVLPDDRSFTMQSPGPGAPVITVWRKGGLIYYMVGPQGPVDAVRTALGAPAPSAPYENQ